MIRNTTIKVRTADDEWYEVRFGEDGEAEWATQSRIVWSKERGTTSKMMNARIQEIIDLAKRPD